MADDSMVRLAAFCGVFGIMALWEAMAARRALACGRRLRWTYNLGLLLVDVSVLRLTLPGLVIAVAVAGESGGWGLLRHLKLPAPLAFVVAILLLDLAIYFQHVMFHAVPVLWRLHRVHHSDVDVDVSTGTRFHPVEIVISMGIKAAAVAAIGASPLAVLTFEVLLNATAVFNRANVSLPRRLEAWVRGILVTPDMHRIHHSIIYNETSSNFGFNVSWWDRLFGTYRERAASDQDAMILGVDAFRDASSQRLDRLLIQPLMDTPSGYAINCRSEAGATVRQTP